MSLGQENRKAVVEYRLERAYRTLEESKMLVEIGSLNLAANRLYYALYYMASALLISIGVPTKSHAGLMTQINLHLVKTGIIPAENAKLMRTIFNLRQESDYDDFMEVQMADIEEYTPRVTELVDKLRSLIDL